MQDWDPEEALTTDHPHITLTTVPRLPTGTLGRTLYDTARVEILAGQPPAQHRSTLAHEYVHVCRGPITLPHLTAREERQVDAQAARLLITFDDLADAMVWCTNDLELAEHLGVDPSMVRARLNNLTPDEKDTIAAHVDDHRLSQP